VIYLVPPAKFETVMGAFFKILLRQWWVFSFKSFLINHFTSWISQAGERLATSCIVKESRFESREELFFIFYTEPRSALGSTQAPIQRVLEALSLGVERWRVIRPGREADHSPPSST
jgi:hypothetical protein